MPNSTKKFAATCATLTVLIAVFVSAAVYFRNRKETLMGTKASTSTAAPPGVPATQHNPFLADPKFQNVLTSATQPNYVAIVTAQAVPTDVVHITSCKPYPQVSAVTLGQPVKIYNVDATAHTLKGPAGSGLSVTIKAKSSASVTLKGTGVSAFNYTCDGAAAGAILTSK